MTRMSTPQKWSWTIELGTFAALDRIIPFRGTEFAAVRRFNRAVRDNPELIVELYRQCDGGKAGKAFRAQYGQRGFR